jgi:hypothetical protein
MKSLLHYFLVILAMTVALPALADDQQKAEKQVNKVTALATDATGRRVVSMTVSDLLNMKRPDVVQERHETGLNYGHLFIAHQLTANSVKMSDIASQLKAGKNIYQIGNDQHANWKQIAADAKKLNSKIEDNLYKHFLNDKADKARDLADNYDPNFDKVKADGDVSKEDLASAQDVYILWRDRATSGRKDTALDTADERAARQGHDHVRNGGPQSDQATPTGGPPQ